VLLPAEARAFQSRIISVNAMLVADLEDEILFLIELYRVSADLGYSLHQEELSELLFHPAADEHLAISTAISIFSEYGQDLDLRPEVLEVIDEVDQLLEVEQRLGWGSKTEIERGIQKAFVVSDLSDPIDLELLEQARRYVVSARA